VQGKPLYDRAEREYPYKGLSLTLTNYGVIIGAVVLLVLLINNNYRHGLPEKPSVASSSTASSH
jgi:hypothetical protein